MSPASDPNVLLGKLASLEAAIVFLLKREFERDVVPRVAATQWFDRALNAAAATDHAHGADVDGQREITARVMQAAYRELLELRGYVLDGML